MKREVRCKFVCRSVEKVADDGYEYKFEPVTTGSEENESFFKYTPYGALHIGVVAERCFEVNKEYYLDIKEA